MHDGCFDQIFHVDLTYHTSINDNDDMGKWVSKVVSEGRGGEWSEDGMIGGVARCSSA